MLKENMAKLKDGLRTIIKLKSLNVKAPTVNLNMRGVLDKAQAIQTTTDIGISYKISKDLFIKFLIIHLQLFSPIISLTLLVMTNKKII